MENKKLGVILIGICIVLSFIVFTFTQALNKQIEVSCSCIETQERLCPHEKQNYWPTYLGIILISGIAALGVYLIFFEKSQKEIISTLERQKQVQSEEEKFEILLKGLDEEEKRVVRAVREQEGITQQTLRYRTDLHKSKLSIILDNLEKKELIYRKPKGKTKQVFLKLTL